MSDELTALLARLIDNWEDELVEFKQAGKDYDTRKIGEYFSALANDANLRGADAGWLAFGINNKTRQVVGTDYRPDTERLQGLKNDIAQGTEPRTSFREIHEVDQPDGRVLIFEVPPAPRGIPISWNGHYYARNGESLGSLSITKQDEIRQQDAGNDWSAVVLPNVTLDDLDPEALAAARTAFATRHPRIPQEEIEGWDDAAFLERASLTVNGGITRAAVLLLGRPQAAYHLLPLMAEIAWKLTGEETAYEHFGLPFLLNTTRANERIRNVQVRMLPPGTFIQTEIQKYDRKSVFGGDPQLRRPRRLPDGLTDQPH
jgi:ATP-dependent DNA helicase RecG